MYSGNNPTALTSQQMFSDALNELLKEKEFKDISVSELCKLSGISRQTFYSLFGTKENILLYQLDNSPALSVTETHSYDRVSTDDCASTANDICKVYADLVASSYPVLQMLVDDDLTSVLGALLIKRLSGCREVYASLTGNERPYAIEFISAGLCALTRKYIMEHRQPDKEALLHLSEKIISCLE